MSGISPKLPLTRNAVDGFNLNVTYREAVVQNFKNLILTSPGERVMDPNFGVGIKRYLFENNDRFFYDEIDIRIQDQVDIYMPFIEIKNVFFDTPNVQGYENYLGVRIEYFIAPLEEFATLNLTLYDKV